MCVCILAARGQQQVQCYTSMLHESTENQPIPISINLTLLLVLRPLKRTQERLMAGCPLSDLVTVTREPWNGRDVHQIGASPSSQSVVERNWLISLACQLVWQCFTSDQCTWLSARACVWLLLWVHKVSVSAFELIFCSASTRSAAGQSTTSDNSTTTSVLSTLLHSVEPQAAQRH